MQISTEMKVGLTQISHLEQNEYRGSSDRSGFSIVGEAITSHLDLLYPLNHGGKLLNDVCSLSEKDLKQLQQVNFYNKAKNSLSWLELTALNKNIDPDLLMRAQSTLSWLAELEIEMSINANLLVQS